MNNSRSALLKTLAFHTIWNHAPTQAEWINTLESRDFDLDKEEVLCEIKNLTDSGDVVLRYGRFVFPDKMELLDEQRNNEIWNSRKMRTARIVTKWLSHLSSVRFVALCNTTAHGHARNNADLDFFIITRAGRIMTTRALAVLPFKLMRKRPTSGHEQDAICLSYFITDDGLDLSSHMLDSSDAGPRTPDRDIYFRYWFLSLLPLYDDGISTELWNSNRQIIECHPFSRPWISPPDLRVRQPKFRIQVSSIFESPAKKLQTRAFPLQIRDVMNKDTRVMVTDKVLKFHVQDGRAQYLNEYRSECRSRGLT